MEPKRVSVLTRRSFIRQGLCAALGTIGLSSAIRDLRFMNAAMALTPAVTDYKALVCIFMSGGNDSNNFIIPTSAAEYTAYAKARQGLAIPKEKLLPITTTNGDGRTYGFHPSCKGLQTLFGEGKIAPLFNAGTLVQPVTRSQYTNGRVILPYQLFSHSDQVHQWQTSVSESVSGTGWGGRCADLLAAVQPDAKISMNIAVGGSNMFEVGNIVSQYAVSSYGAETLDDIDDARAGAVRKMTQLDYPNLFSQAYAKLNDHAIGAGELLNSSIQNTAAEGYWKTPFPASDLGDKLKMIARLIAARSSLGMKRQIFFCEVGGYDTHSDQVTSETDTATGSHANLLGELSGSMFAFQRAMEQLGTTEGSEIAKGVTAFTASDFGRTLAPNGLGSDHGWGGHHVIMGGAVKGKATYGNYPILALDGPDDTSTGRWIPTTSIDQYSATLARWFGLSNNDIANVFPNLGRFASSNLGFL